MNTHDLNGVRGEFIIYYCYYKLVVFYSFQNKKSMVITLNEMKWDQMELNDVIKLETSGARGPLLTVDNDDRQCFRNNKEWE